jgi:transmembrane 9 superfamily protein 2/4
MVASAAPRLAVALVLLGSASRTLGFYLPGVAPTDYKPGDKLTAKVEALTSVRTQLPYEYYVLPFCKDGIDMSNQESLNLGEVLRGSRIYNTPYTFTMGLNQNCKILCQKEYSQEEVQEFALMIEEEYRSHFLVDNLPVAMSVFHETDEGSTVKAYETGYPLGHVVDENGKSATDDNGNEKPRPKSGKQQIVLFNHLRFTVLVHEDPKKGTRRVVGFEVEPFSVKHTYMNEIDFSHCVGVQAGANNKCNLNTCSARHQVGLHERPLLLDVNKKGKTEVIWTYDVAFHQSNIKWSTRWDTYLQSADDAQVHWFSILNSFMIVLFLSGLIAMIMIRTLRRDFQRYDESLEEGQEETGWKLVHGDVFRAPPLASWLCVMIGTGVQLAASAVFLMLFACFGFLSPANRGALMQAMLFIFVFMGMVGGYTSARFFRLFKGTRWKQNSLFTAMVFPGIVFGIFFVLNLMIWGQKSSGAVPFGTLFALLCMWFLISTPLVILGACEILEKSVPNFIS